MPDSERERQYSIAELEELTGQPRRTIHHYISTGLLPRAEGKGPSAYYTHEHYLKLRLISLLVDSGVRPELIQKSLAGWSVQDMERLVHLSEEQPLDDLDKIGRWLDRASNPPQRAAQRIGAQLSMAYDAAPQRAPRPASARPPADLLARAASNPLPSPTAWERIRIGDQLEIAYPLKNDRQQARKIEQLKDFVQHLFADELDDPTSTD